MLPMAVFAYVTGIPGVLVSRVLQAWSLPVFGAVLAAGLMVELHRVARARELECVGDDLAHQPADRER